MIHMVNGDVSGDEETTLTAACYLGLEDQWMNAIAAWCSALEDAEVEEFHATDFFSARRAFDDDRWRRFSNERGTMIPGGALHDAFAERFTSIPGANGLLGFAHSLDGQSFSSILAPELAKEVRTHSAANARTYAIMKCLAGVARFLGATTYREPGNIQAIFEHEQGAGKFLAFFEESRTRKERWTYWFKSFTTAGKSFIPVQMGDLLAHEAWRRTKQAWYSATPERLRRSFETMLGDGRIQLDVLGREECLRSASQVRDLLARFPDGLVPADIPI
jgi:hypothetical protein